jgi:hypothetical protein
MAYVRTRTTKSGAVSTALVESYRDEMGRPRQRLLANLHGEPTALTALAKLAARRDALRKEQAALNAEAVDANEFYNIVTQQTLHGHQYSADERKEIDRLMRQRHRLLRRLEKIEAELAAIAKNGAFIKKHCSATADEIQAAIRAYKQKLHDAEALVLGMEWGLRKHRRELRRLSN